MDNPVEITCIDERVDSLMVNLQKTDNDIENFNAEIEFLVLGDGG
jgi:hypothetical protein